MKITFLADSNKQEATQALRACMKRYGQADLDKADVVVVLGGDGFMLKTLHRLLNFQTPVFGLNLGHVGYLLNHFSLNEIPDRVDCAVPNKIIPLRVQVEPVLGKAQEIYAFNEVAFGRSSPQAARLDVLTTDEKNNNSLIQRQEVFGDGIIVATPLGSHGYYESANGKPVPNDKEVIAVQAVASKGNFNQILSDKGNVCIVPKELPKRPVHIDKDGQERIKNVKMSVIQMAHHLSKTLLVEKSKR